MMRNGADKTTTVRILATLISPTVGSALVAGIPVGPEGAAEIRKRIAVMHGLIAGLGDRGVTVFLATRRLEEAKRLCDRVGHHEHQSVEDRQAFGWRIVAPDPVDKQLDRDRPPRLDRQRREHGLLPGHAEVEVPASGRYLDLPPATGTPCPPSMIRPSSTVP